MSNIPKLLAILISMAFYGFSLFLPAVTAGKIGKEASVFLGIDVLKMGWLAPLSPYALFTQWAWYANSLYIVSIGFLIVNKYTAASNLALAAILLSLNTFLWFWIPIQYGSVESSKEYLIGLNGGYYFWVASIGTIYIFSILSKHSSRVK